MNTSRYLIPLDYKAIAHHFTDVLIIGGGLSGIRAAMAVDPSQSVLLAVKSSELEYCASTRAQGGIASVLDPKDNFEGHIQDTLVAGANLCNEEVVRKVVKEGPQRVLELIKWGTQFDRNKEQKLELTREGGHGFNRIAHALGDATGREIMRAMIAKVKTLPNIRIWRNTFAIDLITDAGICYGAIFYNPIFGKEIVWAKQTILATGGVGQLYRETTNPEIATGDGIAMAYRAGVRLRGMEFVQFHPTVLYVAGGTRSLITEAIRGEGAYLIDKNGNRFMPDYDSRAELAPRDIVSRSIVAQMRKTNSTNVYLTLKHLNSDYVRHRFPGIDEICSQFGIDITKDNIPVRPGAHYMMGGIEVDVQARTNIEGLRAIGECASTGLHGANRLASNSLLEAVVFGKTAGEGASEVAKRMSNDFTVFPIRHNRAAALRTVPLDVDDIRNSVKSLMQRDVGVIRNKEGLEGAQETIANWQKYVCSYEFNHTRGWELQNMLTIGWLIAHSALLREETRGGHSRSDFPERETDWRKYTIEERDTTGDEADETESV